MAIDPMIKVFFVTTQHILVNAQILSSNVWTIWSSTWATKNFPSSNKVVQKICVNKGDQIFLGSDKMIFNYQINGHYQLNN